MALQGDLRTMPLTDLFQWVELSRTSGALVLEHRGVQQRHVFEDGILQQCLPEAGDEAGLRALLSEVMRWPAGSFEFVAGVVPVPGASRLGLSVTPLLLDLVREYDEEEEQRASNPVPNLDEEGARRLRHALVDQLLNEAIELPLPPGVAGKVLEISRRPDFSLRDLSEVILTDPVIAAKVLQQANSAMYQLRQPVASLPHACSLLGARAVTTIVLRLSFQSLEDESGGRFAPLRADLWARARLCSMVATVAGRLAGLDRDLSGLCGLMMDLGQIALLSALEELLEGGQFERPSATELIALIDDYHPKLGQQIGVAWSLPPEVVAVMALHHQPERADEHDRWAYLAHLVDDVVAQWEIAQGDPSCPPPDPLELLEHPAAVALGLDFARLQQLADSLPLCEELLERIPA